MTQLKQLTFGLIGLGIASALPALAADDAAPPFRIMSEQEVSAHTKIMNSLEGTARENYRDAQYEQLKERARQHGYRMPASPPWAGQATAPGETVPSPPAAAEPAPPAASTAPAVAEAEGRHAAMREKLDARREAMQKAADANLERLQQAQKAQPASKPQDPAVADPTAQQTADASAASAPARDEAARAMAVGPGPTPATVTQAQAAAEMAAPSPKQGAAAADAAPAAQEKAAATAAAAAGAAKGAAVGDAPVVAVSESAAGAAQPGAGTIPERSASPAAPPSVARDLGGTPEPPRPPVAPQPPTPPASERMKPHFAPPEETVKTAPPLPPAPPMAAGGGMTVEEAGMAPGRSAEAMQDYREAMRARFDEYMQERQAQHEENLRRQREQREAVMEQGRAMQPQGGNRAPPPYPYPTMPAYGPRYPAAFPGYRTPYWQQQPQR